MTLKHLRLSRGMTQGELAAEIGITQQAEQRIETGKGRPSPETAERIRRYFGLTTDDIWGMFYSQQDSA